MGYAIHVAQIGDKHPNAKALKGFKGAGVLEIVDDHDGDTYRAIYTVKFAGAVYVLHALSEEVEEGHRHAEGGPGTDREPTETSKRPLRPNLRDQEDRLNDPNRGT